MTRPFHLVIRELAHRAPVLTAEQDSAIQGSIAQVAATVPASVTPRASRRRQWLFVIATGVFVSWLAIGTWGGYRAVPLATIALAGLYGAYLASLTLVFWVREGAENPKSVQAAQQSGAAAVADRLLEVSIGDIGRTNPGSIDTAMHLELGTLSPAHLAQGGGTSLWRPHSVDLRPAQVDMPIPGRKAFSA
jgi:hypothetical protein